MNRVELGASEFVVMYVCGYERELGVLSLQIKMDNVVFEKIILGPGKRQAASSRA